MNRLSRKSVEPTYEPSEAPTPKITFTEKELRARLNDDEYWVTQQQGMWWVLCPSHTPHIRTTEAGHLSVEMGGAEGFSHTLQAHK